ncbi:MAG: biotin/lipoate A/B protein ligase family protein [Promethearchaeota archaeon]
MKNLNWRLLDFSINRASENMAIDEALLRCYEGENVLRLYGWKPSAVSIGRHQHIKDEVNLHSLRKFGFDCVRRISGGGAVFHDEIGELTYSVVTDVKNLEEITIKDTYFEISKIIFQPLEKLGIILDYDQIHCPSVFSGGKKISGNAQAREGKTILQHGTILVKFRPEIMYSVLKARLGRTQESMVHSVYQHITTFSNLLREDIDPQSIANYLVNYLTKNYSSQYIRGELTLEEKQMSSTLATDKYESEEWLYSR